MDFALFILSGSMLVWTSGILAHSFSKKPFDRFWIFLSAAYLQISTLSLLLSLFRILAPVPFIFCQVLLVIVFIIWRTQNRLSLWPFDRPRLPDWGLMGVGLFLLSLLILGSSFLSRVLNPIQWGDVLYYHASRPLYWIQHQSIGPYPTVNDRQISFAFGSDLIFLYPVLFAREEIVGRLFYWLGTPLAAYGFYTVMRQMGQKVVWSLKGVVLFLTIPLVYIYSGTLEPLIWMCLFALGAGYWTLRLSQSSRISAVTVCQLGIFAVLTANLKNYGLALVGGVILVFALNVWLRKPERRFWARMGSVFLVCLLFTTLLSGLGLLFGQNLALYGSLTGSELRAQENLAELSPYQLYVHLVRLGAVLGEFPVPFFSEAVDQLGQGVIELLGADRLLPKEDVWSWVGHYQYQSKELYQPKSFGVLGLILAAGGWGLGSRLRKKFKRRTFREAGREIVKSPSFSYFLVSLSLVLGPALLLRWIDSGTRSFLAPGLICLLPLAVSGLSGLHLRRLAPVLVTLLVLIFILTFSVVVLYRGVLDLKFTAPHWGHIKYSRRKPHISSDRYIPRDATVILLAYPNTKDYYFFGEDYTRRVIQWPESLNKQSFTYLQTEFPDAYIFLDPNRCSLSFNNYARQMVHEDNPNFQYLEGECDPDIVMHKNSITEEIDWPHDGKLYRFREGFPDY